MGKLDKLFARNFNVSKLKILLNLGISRIAVLRNQRQARYHLDRSDIVQILNLGHHDRSLLRVEQVIKERNMLDVLVMIESYCNLLIERINLVKQEKVCPEELREAVSGIIYASTRCGEFPELIEMRTIFTSRFGKEFAARAVELRNNCGVNPKMIQKLSTRQPVLEIRLRVLKEIAAENNIVLKFDDDYSIAAEDNLKKEQNRHRFKTEEPDNLGSLKFGDGSYNVTETEKMYEVSDSMKVRRKYKDVADAAQAAFESAAHAAAAARIAVELSKSGNHDPDDQNDPSFGRRRVRDEIDSSRSENQPTKQGSLSTTSKYQTAERELGNSDIHIYDSESEDEEIQCDIPTSDEGVLIEKGINFDKSDDETENGDKNNNSDLDYKSSFIKKDTESGNFDSEVDISQKRFPLRSEAGTKTDSGYANYTQHLKEESKVQNPQRLEEKNPISVRTRFRTWKH